MSKTVFFRCDASPGIGSGHVYRCMTLADALIARGWTCRFMSAPGSEDIVPALKKNVYGLVRDAVEDLKADLLVVDHYGMDAEFETACRGWAKKIAVIDDLADRAHHCDVLIDQTHGRNAHDYRDLLPDDCGIYTGAEYALLRPQFADKREESLKRRKNIPARPRVLVSLGSTNIGNATGKVVAALKEFKSVALDVDVVLGASAPGTDKVRADIADINKAGLHHVTYHENVGDMAALMAQADLAIGAGGTTSWERCCLGLPALMIEIADNQRLIAENLQKAGAVENIGFVTQVTPADIAVSLRSLLENPARIITMGQRAASICDGQGAERIAEILNA